MITPSLVECNYNFNDEILNAITLLIEQSLTSDEFDDRFLPVIRVLIQQRFPSGKLLRYIKISWHKVRIKTCLPPQSLLI